MATGGSPIISQSMVPSFTSTLRRSNRSKSNISLIQKSKNYELNKQKAIDKKRSDCNSPHIKYEMKPKNNFCISFSTAAYELVKHFLHEYFDKLQRQDAYAIAVKNVFDKSTAIVETRFRIFNKKRDGSFGNQHKYTVNCYNTTSRILVNGVKTDKFVKHSDIDKIRDKPCVCRLCIENNLYSPEIVHYNTSVNNTVNDVLQLDQQEPAIEFPKDKDQSTLPPEDEMKRIQQNIQIVETNSSIVITEESQSNDQNMVIISNSVQVVVQNKNCNRTRTKTNCKGEKDQQSK
ncbi:unnamed protein product [Mytilus coruscus]|uniref:Uncharacterized protein n=1 Tax=Mytilus coruscus TaxID=42192 RepID=A0A6J8DLV7_MYTCO|nr:unnamed protein product [Mytilus coruscus]